ncbi:hypothetical protein PVAND_007303 [Polypedilum vanderplanki]|uniref:Uncharacterized protein n=1 Tax=Polypedilum vanderplanki TaxID=319348 RepID=A0A9J6C6S2_POLVA|nr:hypothetical protein PVAND_007303 [Polypedilum vanderplanki]
MNKQRTSEHKKNYSELHIKPFIHPKLPKQQQLKNSDCISNYVDRVRICDTKSITSESVYSKASSSQKSGWRQKSYSSIDLSSSGDYNNQPGAGAFRYRDFDAQDDTSVKNSKNSKNKENQRDYEDIYNVNPKAQGYKREIIKEHNKINQNQRDNDVCSLRRSKSLAVIREETYNDLSIGGPKTRRSQLIPRAKLIDRHFFKDRLSFALEEGLSFSLDSNLTGENLKNSCSTIKSNNSGRSNVTSNANNNGTSSNNNNNYFSWNCDKSDLDSIDSNFFKNSLHQSALLEKLNSLKIDSSATKIVSRAEIHNEHSESDGLENGSVKTVKKSENIINDNESIVNINEDTESGITIIEIKDKNQLSGPTSSVISYDSIYLSSESDKQTILGDIIDNNTTFDDIDSKIRDFEKIIRELNLIGESEKSDTIIDNLYSQVAKGSRENLFDLTIGEQTLNSNTLSKYTDYISKGTLERLAILSGFSPHNSSSRKPPTKEARKSKDVKDNSGSNKGDLQYSSLPDIDISKLLRDCELIDAKLRDDVSIELLEPFPDYDIDLEFSHEHPDSLNIEEINNNNNQLQLQSKEVKEDEKESIEVNNININNTASSVVSLNSIEPISLDEENPKGAPSIEVVQLPTKELECTSSFTTDAVVIDSVEKKKYDNEENDDERLKNTTKIYIADLGLELDYENSIASFESDEDFGSPTVTSTSIKKDTLAELNNLYHHHHPLYNPPTINLVTISGRKVIVDELAAKSEQKDTIQTYNSNNNRDRETLQNNKNRDQRQLSQTKKVEHSAVAAVKVEKPKRVSIEKTLSAFHESRGEKDKLNGADSKQQQRVNKDKRVERKIKQPECKQQSVDNTTDKEKLFRKNSNVDECYSNYNKTAAAIEKNSQILDSEKVTRVSAADKQQKQQKNSKDYTSFCIIQKSNLEQNNKMPRPQLLNIIDSKNSTPKQQQQQNQLSQLQKSSNLANSNKDIRIIITNDAENEKQHPLNPTEKEFLHKVDSVRNYWSKMLDNEDDDDDVSRDMKRNNLKTISKAFSTSKSSSDIPQSLRNEDGFQSFFPTVEIVELNNGETQAALVTARKLNDVEFDHVRYKVMKSEMFQKNIVRSTKHRKETQFDGLMQYLQDYSFQELLANNNVVIIEPVRTKIEKVPEKPNVAQSAVCKITNGAETGLTRNNSNNLKKHFFYHPIRVNKELYEDELPVPDTVRNVRKLFEESLRAKLATSKDTNMSKSSDSLKPRKTIRYLTIDTSFDNNLATSKWDSISLSSGVSSAADLSSPCECQENALNRNSSSNGSKENLLDQNEATPFVNVDVLEKIRENECEPSINYYSQGGVMTSLNENEKNNSELMTRVMAREKCNCQGRQSRFISSSSSNEKHHHYHHQPQQLSNKKMNNDYTGLKFKLVKSNSCSSRLELAGTGVGGSTMEEMRNIVHGQQNHLYDEDGETDEERNDDKRNFEHEETVKDMIYKLETRNFAPTKPRIIESRCIEKAKVTINNQSLEKVKPINSNSSTSSSTSSPNFANFNSQQIDSVTVNNHISILNTPSVSTTNTNEQHQNMDNSNEGKILSKPKIVRNKNVDLALSAVCSKKKELAQNEIHENSSSSKDSNNNNNVNNTAAVRTSKNITSSPSMMQSVEMVKNQDKINYAHHTKNHAHPTATNTVVKASPEAPKSNTDPKILSSDENHEHQSAKMVNWSTVGILSREYIANDNKLTQKKTFFDEMDFEEFEVAGEHYDSLNSK